MPIACRHKTELGRPFCVSECPGNAPCGAFRFARVEKPEDLPPADPRVIDVALLDLNHGWQNLGHDSLVHAVLETSCDLQPLLDSTGLALRVISFAVRDHGMVPEGPGGRFAVYLGTGGPGHLDPRCNDGVAPYSQGIHEDPSWEAPAFALFDAIRDDADAALFAVCHTFGVLCRWSGAARPVPRGEDKGGKLSGVLENVLTDEAQRHPWFGRLAAELPGGRRLRILDNRLFDLIPQEGAPPPEGFVAIGYESAGGDAGEALTMMELARDRDGVVPRIFGVNHHPEIVNRSRQVGILRQKLQRGEVSEQWVRERMEILTRVYPDEDSEQRLHLTSDYTLLAPLRFHLYRQVRQRAEALGLPVDLHEERALELAG